jgi:photosystem II stability/assembly factor-like uncharacterized protein
MKRSLRPVLAALFLFFPSASFALDAHWEFAGWDGGGCYPDIVFDPNVRGRMYVSSDVAGIWVSDDAGEKWRFATRGLGHLHVSALAVSPSDPQTVYAGTEAGLYVSRDAGERWSAAGGPGARFSFTRPESHHAILVFPSDPANLVIGNAEGEIWHSGDAGQTWKKLGAPFPKKTQITAMAWNVPGESLYAASTEGIARISLKEDKAGLIPGSPKPVTDLLTLPDGKVLAAGQKGLRESADGGKTWKETGRSPQGVFFRLASGAEGRLVAAWNEDWKGGTIASSDGGATWEKLDKEMRADTVSNPTRKWANAGGRINALESDPFDRNVVFRTDWWGIWKSADGGLTWDEKIKGAPNTVPSDILVTPEGELLVATMDNGLLKSADGGKTYETLFPRSGYKDDENGHVWRVARNPRGEIVATSSPWNSPREQVVISRDGGATFEKTAQGLPAKRPEQNTLWNKGYAKALAVHPTDPDRLYVGIDGDGGGFFVSVDGGRSWRRPRQQPDSLKIYNGLAVDPRDPRRIYWGASGKHGGVYRSEDGGESWTMVLRQMRKVFDVIVAPGGTVYAGGDQGGPALFRSTDNGEHWEKVRHFGGKGSVEGLCLLPDGRLALGVVRWAGTPDGEFYLGSADGKGWERFDGDLPPGDGPAAMTYDAKTKTLYMARYAGSVFRTRLE